MNPSDSRVNAYHAINFYERLMRHKRLLIWQRPCHPGAGSRKSSEKHASSERRCSQNNNDAAVIRD